MKRLLSTLLVFTLLLTTLMSVAAVPASAAEGGPISYTEVEENDFLYTANTIGNDYLVSGIVNNRYDYDYFCFHLTEELSVVRLDALSNYEDVIRFSILDVNGDRIVYYTPNEPSEDYYGFSASIALEAGTYYLCVSDNYSSFTDAVYAFSLQYEGHVHSYSSNCDPECDGCSMVRDDLQHTFNGNCDTTCEYCDETRISMVKHTYDNNCDATCNVCGDKRTAASHTYKKVVTAGSLTANGVIMNVCTECGYTSSKTTTIYKASSFTLSKTSFTYNGKVQKPTVTVKDSKGEKISSSNYTVTYASGCKKAGTYKVTIKMKGNYSGTKTLTYKINKQTASKVTVKVSKSVLAYNGKAQLPTLTVKDSNGNSLKKNTDYTVKLPSGRKNVGKYTVKITFKGNYSGTKSVSYTIAPTAKETVNVVKGGTSSIGAKSNSKITYTSSKKTVATVSSKGVITAKKAGTAVITVKSGSITRKITVKVTNPSISISAKAKSVYRGKKLQLTAKANPSGAKVTWSVNNKKIATVSSSGVVTGKKYGTVTVTAKITYKGKTYKSTYKVQVKVASPDVSVFISKKSDYTNLYAVSFTNNGSKSLKILNTGWVYVGGDSAYSTGKLYSNNGYSNSITVPAGKSSTFVYTLKEKLLFLSTYRVACYVYFEYDGETYIAKCDSERYGIQKCHTITHLID